MYCRPTGYYYVDLKDCNLCLFMNYMTEYSKIGFTNYHICRLFLIPVVFCLSVYVSLALSCLKLESVCFEKGFF